jgi:hypothetical protein
MSAAVEREQGGSRLLYMGRLEKRSGLAGLSLRTTSKQKTGAFQFVSGTTAWLLSGTEWGCNQMFGTITRRIERRQLQSAIEAELRL